ncbi:peptidase inhibitor family I36 protein [Pseudomonas umsongensis]|nr:peptidase inhibitor family I36 protein [Pseudomonas umsongensis]
MAKLLRGVKAAARNKGATLVSRRGARKRDAGLFQQSAGRCHRSSLLFLTVDIPLCREDAVFLLTLTVFSVPGKWSLYMNSKWLVAFVALCLGVGALFFSAKQATVERSPYALFEPGMTTEQKVMVQRQIERQLSRKSGGKQISTTQVVYDNGAAVVTFPVPGDAGQSDRNCDYGYVCFWTASDFAGRKLSLLSTAKNGPVNLSDYDMSAQVFSWQHNNKTGTVKIFGVDGPGAKGNMVMSNIREVILGKGCCPFSVPEDARVVGTWTEINAQSRLTENNRIMSIAFAPMFMLFAH